MTRIGTSARFVAGAVIAAATVAAGAATGVAVVVGEGDQS